MSILSLRWRTLASQSVARASKALARYGVALNATLPYDWPSLAAAELPSGRMRVSTVMAGRRAVAMVIDRGWSHQDDWVREVWLHRLDEHWQGRALAAFVADGLTRTRATHLRWRASSADAVRHERMWERLGARPLGYLAPTSSDASEWLVYQWQRHGARRAYFAGHGLHVGPPRPSEIALLVRWASDPTIHEPLGYRSTPSPAAMRDLVLPGVGERPSPMVFHMVRLAGTPVGAIIEHPWDYVDDSIRELDMTFPGLAHARPTLLAHAVAAVIDDCFRRGARHVIGNGSAGRSGRGYPRFFALVGGSDVTEGVRVIGGGQADRRYFAGTPATFYRSPLGVAFGDASSRP
ncbi:MAG: hypothetical protein AAB426_08370 [Myxococcota bacterium]